jgi:hypothetical protein
MCEADTASAVLGNHELNAIAWATPNGQGGFLREHSTKNAAQHAAFLDQLGERSPEYDNAINWFRQLPVWLELPGLRVATHVGMNPLARFLSRILMRGSPLRTTVFEKRIAGARKPS